MVKYNFKIKIYTQVYTKHIITFLKTHIVINFAHKKKSYKHPFVTPFYFAVLFSLNLGFKSLLQFLYLVLLGCWCSEA